MRPVPQTPGATAVADPAAEPVFLLDSNVWVEHLRGVRGAPSIRDRLRATPAARVKSCSVVRGELIVGAEKSADRAGNLAKVERLLAPYESLPYDDACADVYGRLRGYLETRGTPLAVADLMIAAVAVRHGLTLVSHNRVHFERIPRLAFTDWQRP